ncbi:Mbeg1-like protein [Pseudobutyrivibrio sp.]|jgi:hypothetical protein|uniref:Mbeg1-like protein n=1 Tax=Pseudobutyrivibrio sp. TaxID=2014367 RepID=UPI00386FBA5B
MDGVFDYIKWYGEFSFEDKALTEVDNFILTKIAYLIIEGIEFDKPHRFRDVVKKLEATCGIRGCFYGKEQIVIDAANSKRYGDMYVSNYLDIYDQSISAQFAAMTFDLTEDVRFVAYRGTDETLAGWKEDFMISFMETEAQKKSLEYLKDSFDGVHKVYVGGHSKGGNLALYAAAHLEDEELQKQLKYVYINDGPGLCPEVCDNTCVARIKNKAMRFMPEYSVFGKLFEETQIPGKIVKSSAEGVAQHDCVSWAVDHGNPDYSDSFSPGSVFINQILDQWIESVNNERRISFVNNLFNSIEKSGYTTTTEIMEKGPFAIEKILIKLLALDKKTVRTLMKLPVTAALDRAPDEEKVNIIRKKVKKKEWLSSICMILLSVILFMVPEYILQVGISLVLLAIILFEIGVTIRHLYKAGGNLQEESGRVYVCIVMIGVYAMLLVKEDALFFIGSVAIGVAFLFWAYRNAIAYKNLCANTEKKDQRLEKVKLLVEIVVLIILSAFIFVAPKDTLTWYMTFLAVVFLVDGIVNLIIVLRNLILQNRK